MNQNRKEREVRDEIIGLGDQNNSVKEQEDEQSKKAEGEHE